MKIVLVLKKSVICIAVFAIILGMSSCFGGKEVDIDDLLAVDSEADIIKLLGEPDNHYSGYGGDEILCFQNIKFLNSNFQIFATKGVKGLSNSPDSPIYSIALVYCHKGMQNGCYVWDESSGVPLDTTAYSPSEKELKKAETFFADTRDFFSQNFELVRDWQTDVGWDTNGDNSEDIELMRNDETDDFEEILISISNPRRFYWN